MVTKGFSDPWLMLAKRLNGSDAIVSGSGGTQVSTVLVVRTPPEDLALPLLQQALADGWGVDAAGLEYVPEGGGSHHWRARGHGGPGLFVTVDDLENKPWFGDVRDAVYELLGRAYSTAIALSARLEFVVAPLPTGDGHPIRRLDDRYTVSLWPFLAGHSYPFGPYRDPRLRDDVQDMLAALHGSTGEVLDLAPSHAPSFGGRADLEAFLADPARAWKSGPFAERAWTLLAPRRSKLVELVRGYDELCEKTLSDDLVVTHGEPHPANLLSAGGKLFLVDWDTVALARRERDLALLTPDAAATFDRYERATGSTVDPAAITLYRARWYLDDVASAVRLFRNPHVATEDTRRWWEALAGCLDELPYWSSLLG